MRVEWALPRDLPTARCPTLSDDRRDAVPLGIVERRRLAVLSARAAIIPRMPRVAVLVVLPDRRAIATSSVDELPLAAARKSRRGRRSFDPTPRPDPTHRLRLFAVGVGILAYA